MIEPDIARILEPATILPLPPPRFSVDDVVARGTTIRRRRHRSALVACCIAVVAAVGLVAWHPGLGSGQQQSPSAQSLARAEATNELTFLLGRLPLPTGAVPSQPEAGVGRANAAPKGHAEHVVRWFTVPGDPEAAESWLVAHSWGGSFLAGGGSGPHNSWQVQFTTAGQRQDRADPWPLIDFTLQSHGQDTVIRADGWLASRAEVARPADTLLPSGTTRMAVTEGSYTSGAYTSTLSLDVSGSPVQALTLALNARPATVADTECDADRPTRLAFRSGGHDIVFTYLPFCGSLAVSVDGRPRPPLAAFDEALQTAIAAVAPGIG